MSAAYAAMDQGDFATAQAEFALALKQNPGDTLATARSNQATFLQRVSALQDREAILKAATPCPISMSTWTPLTSRWLLAALTRHLRA